MKKFYIYKFIFIFSFSFFVHIVYSQNNQWTWVNGDSTISSAGVYGVKGVASSSNKPGARSRGYNWTDASGSLWLFGGFKYDTTNEQMNDLWKYDISNNQWAWVSGDSTVRSNSIYGIQGVTSASNQPGAREGGFSWADASGNLWLFGGSGYLNGNYGWINELWKYNILSNQWTWMKGDSGILNTTGKYGIKGVSSPANTPPAKFRSVGWTDGSGDLWLFGGFGISASQGTPMQNDLWKYNISTNEWTWVNGDSVFSTGSYGIKGIALQANKPGGRYNSVSWTDRQGNFWLFGGYGLTDNGSGSLNDLWMYNHTNNIWTWMNGDNKPGSLGVYGTQKISFIDNKPGGRLGSASFVDALGNLWLFGGSGYGASQQGVLNDLWEYSIGTNEWTWVKGDSSVNNFSVYGSLEVNAEANKPGSRYELGGYWSDALGSPWLFGGSGLTMKGAGALNDLWGYSISHTLPVTIISFTGVLQGEACRLNWIENNEINLDHYEIERSVDGVHYVKVGVVKATDAKQYSYLDYLNSIIEHKIYYRLKVIDKNRKFDYSNVLLIEVIIADKFKLYPNPTKTFFYIKTETNLIGKVVIIINDESGKIVATKSLIYNNADLKVNLNDLQEGTYTVTAIYNGNSHIQKIIVLK